MENIGILGDLAGNYEFLSEINSSENSRLFLLYDKLCSRKVLLKSGKADLIENEARLLSKVAGKGIPAVYGCLESDGGHYILRQYIEGRNLCQCIEEDGLFTPKRAVELVVSLCEIVSRLHRCDPAVIHRDIKLENIVLTSKGELYIIDFGISRQYDSNAIRDTCVMGTLSSAPPEQYGYGQTDERSDIYSIGVLLREIVGKENIESDKKLLKIVTKCTMFSPDDRYSSVSDIKKDLEKLFFVTKHIKWKKFALTAAIFAFFMGLSTLFGMYLARPNPIKIDSSEQSSDDIIGNVIASGECGAEGGNVTWQFTSDGVLTISGSGAIADWWGGFPWEVENQATSIVIEEGIKGIGGNMLFHNFINLTAIEVAENNPQYCSIDGVLFSKDGSTIYCYPRSKEGESYVIPNGVTTIGGFAFGDRTQLRSITIPEGVTEIRVWAFTGCTGLASIVLPKTVKSIDGALGGLVGVEAIELADGCANYCTVDGVLFTADMSVLIAYPAGKSDVKYTVPAGVTEIGGCSFNSSKNLTSVVISDSVSRINYGAFENCTDLRIIKIPGSVKRIDGRTFTHCTSLESIVFPRYLEWAGERIFAGCSSLTDIYCKSDEGQYDWDRNWNKDYAADDITAQIHWGYDDGTE